MWPATDGRPAEALRLPRDDFIFVIVAILRARKGHRYLLQALARLPAAKARLLIIGDGPQEQDLRQRIATLGLDERVTLTGRQDDVVPFLNAADTFVLPSTDGEGVPQALLQAMACRLPIVASRVGGISELLDGLPAIHLAEPKNADSLSAAMTAAMNDTVTEEARDALRDRVMHEYSLDRMYAKALRSFQAAMTPESPSTELLR